MAYRHSFSCAILSLSSIPSLKPTACPLKTGKLLASPKRKVVSQPSIFRGDWLVLWSVIHLFNTLTVLPLPSWNPMKPAPGCASQMEWPQGEAPQLHLKYLTSDVNWRWFWRQNQWITAKPSDQNWNIRISLHFNLSIQKRLEFEGKQHPWIRFTKMSKNQAAPTGTWPSWSSSVVFFTQEPCSSARSIRWQ